MEQKSENPSIINHVATSVVYVKDSENNIKKYNSAIHDKVMDITPTPTNQKIKNDIIENIEDLVLKIGMFSSRLYNYDDFDRVQYNKEDIVSNRLIMGEMVGYYTPYDLVIYHKSNEWKCRCLNMEFDLSKNIIPIVNTDFPRIVKIPRSNGNIQKGIIPTKGGFIIRKNASLGDDENRLYARVYFDNLDNIEVTMDNEYNLKYYKDIPLENILKFNLEIKEFTINHYLFTESDYNEESELTDKSIKDGVLEYYDNKKKLWILEIVNPIINNLKNVVDIKNVINSYSRV